jgi:hypothetical protein
MKELFTAIYTKFAAEPHNALYTALGGQLYNTQVPDGVAMPWGVYTLVSNIPRRTFDAAPIEMARIQISLFSDDTMSAVEVTNLYAYADALFDHCELTISGHSHLKMERTFNQLLKEPDYWHYIIEYQVSYE